MPSILNLSLPFLAYLFGSIPSAIVVCRVMALPDPRSTGSHNPGATNVLRIGGKKAAALTLAGDVLKGLVPVLVAGMLSDNSVLITLTGVGAVLGHLYPLFSGFKGGKGVATAAGVFIGMSAKLSALLLLVWLVSAMLFRYSSLAALITAAAAPGLVLWLLPHPSYFAMSLAMAVLLFWRHRENIRRLLTGKEGRIKFSSAKRK